MRLFDEYVAVDWSARSEPKRGRDSIWIGRHGAAPVNPPTRHDATETVRQILHDATAAGRRVLVGFDFPYGYPAGFADLVNPGGTPAWSRVWEFLERRIADDERNGNNRFDVASAVNRSTGGPGPFWGAPASRQTPYLTGKRTCAFPYRGLAELRAVEEGTPGIQSCWKLGGAGSVGSQALVGIPRLASLRHDPALRRASAVWPFETGFAVPDASIVHVEIWPGLVAAAPHAVRDAGQVAGVVADWAARDRDGRLAALFAPLAAPASVALEEGWIFG